MDAPSRRGFLRGAAGLALASALAGCAAQPGSLTPALPRTTIREAGWRLTDELEDSTTEEIAVAGTTQRVDVEARAKLFENAEPLRLLADRLEFDASELALPPEAFVAAKARIDPPHVRVVALSDTVLPQLINAAEARATGKLEAYGFQDVRRIDEGQLQVESGATAAHRLYRADYPFESFTVTVGDQAIRVEPDVLTIEAQLAVWPQQGLLVTGAGVYPAESGRLVATVGGVTQELPLEFQPARYREGVRRLIRLVS